MEAGKFEIHYNYQGHKHYARIQPKLADNGMDMEYDVYQDKNYKFTLVPLADASSILVWITKGGLVDADPKMIQAIGEAIERHDA
jgi:hypothetical protein